MAYTIELVANVVSYSSYECPLLLSSLADVNDTVHGL